VNLLFVFHDIAVYVKILMLFADSVLIVHFKFNDDHINFRIQLLVTTILNTAKLKIVIMAVSYT